MSTRPGGAGTVIIGASLAGLRTGQALRALGYAEAVTLVGADTHLPYDRPPLSKQVLTGDCAADRTALTDAAALAEQQIDLVLGDQAQSLDVGTSTVTLASGRRVTYDRLVIATGARARQPFPAAPEGVQTLRDLDDALALATALDRIDHLVIVGAGFIGLEVASSARARGVAVTVLEAASAPLSRAVDAAVADQLCWHARQAGVDIRCGIAVTGFRETEGHVSGVLLDAAEEVPTDHVVVGVGVQPNTEWLAGSGLDLSGQGVHCDLNGQVLAAGWPQDRIWAVGDVAAWADADGEHLRREHWTSAGEQARAVAASIVGAAPAKPRAPYVWSDQYGVTIALVGQLDRHDDVRVLGGPEDLAVLYARDDRLVGACVVGQPGLTLKVRRWIAAGEPVAEIPAWSMAAG